MSSPESLCLQGTSGNFLVPRIEDHKTIRVSVLGSLTNSRKEGLRKGLLSYYYRNSKERGTNENWSGRAKLLGQHGHELHLEGPGRILQAQEGHKQDQE